MNINTKLGTFVYNEKYNFYELNSDNYDVILYSNDRKNQDFELAINSFKKYEDEFEKFELKIRYYISNNLLNEANEYQGDDGLEELSTEDLFNRIKSPGFSFYPDGSVEVYYDDDDIFSHQMIHASVSNEGEIILIELQ